VLDRNERPISLTALAFGRHHPLFNVAAHVQFRQVSPGEIEVLIVPAGEEPEAWADLFDQGGVAIDFRFRTITEPIRTAAGKVPLLVEHGSRS
jgi:phenylacetate-CoA ligase